MSPLKVGHLFKIAFHFPIKHPGCESVRRYGSLQQYKKGILLKFVNKLYNTGSGKKNINENESKICSKQQM